MAPVSERRRFVVPASLHGRPLDGAVRTLAEVSWGAARKLIARGKIELAGAVVTDAERLVRSGEIIAIDPHARRPIATPGVDRSILVYVDPQVVVVDKPAGISTVPYEAGERGTLDQLVSAMLPRTHKGPAASLGVVQRLDKDTSGLIVFARTLVAKKALGGQLRARTVHRVYLALVHGSITTTTFRSYLVKDRGDGLRGTSRFGREGQLAITHVEPVRRVGPATLVKCRLETGRTHQIRIHLAEGGHPILGERVYVRDYEGHLIPAPRPMLHAAELGFVHPTQDRLVSFRAPLPRDFERTISELAALRD